MFCTNCGKPIPDGQKNCGFCGTPTEEPIFQPPVQEPVFQPPVQEPVYQPPVQQPVYEAPVQQPVYQAPVQQPVYQAPVQQPAPTQPAFTLNTPAEGRKKKAKGGKVVLAVIAILVVAGMVLAALNWNSVLRFFNRNFGEPAAYLQDVEKEKVSEVADDVATVYDSALAFYEIENPAIDTSIKLEIGSTMMTLLNTVMAQNGMELDLTWVENIMLEPKVEMYEDILRMNVGIGLNGVHLATASVIWDTNSQMIYIGVPELHSTYIEVDASEFMDYDAASMAQSLAMSREYGEIMLKALPESEQVKELINKYMGIVIDGISEAEKANETVKVGSLKQNLLVVTAKLSQKDVLKIASSVLDAAQDDKIIEDILDNLDDCMASISGESIGVYDAFVETVEEGLDSLDYMIDEAEGGKFLTIKTFFDSKDAIVGHTFTVDMDGSKVSANYITVTEGNKWAFEAEADTITITGKGTIENDKRNGSYTLSVEGTDFVTLELEDVIATEQQITGTFHLIPESAVFDMMDLDSSLSSGLGMLSLDLTLATDSVTIGVGSLVSLTLSGTVTEAEKIALPESISTEDDDAGMQWLAELDFEAILSNLDASGVPGEYMEMADALVEMFRAEID